MTIPLEFLFNSSSYSNSTLDLVIWTKIRLQAMSFLFILNIVLALIGNTSCFIIFRTNKSLKKMSSMVYLSFVAITDTLTLFVWNLNKFTDPNFGFQLTFLHIGLCRFLPFLQHFSLLASASLLSMLTIDR